MTDTKVSNPILYSRRMPNSPRGAPQGARIPQRILLGGSNIARVFCVGVPKTRESKFPMTPVFESSDGGAQSYESHRQAFSGGFSGGSFSSYEPPFVYLCWGCQKLESSQIPGNTRIAGSQCSLRPAEDTSSISRRPRKGRLCRIELFCLCFRTARTPRVPIKCVSVSTD